MKKKVTTTEDRKVDNPEEKPLSAGQEAAIGALIVEKVCELIAEESGIPGINERLAEIYQEKLDRRGNSEEK